MHREISRADTKEITKNCSEKTHKVVKMLLETIHLMQKKSVTRNK